MLKNETFFVIFKHCGMISLCKSYQNHQNCLIWIFTPNFMNFCSFHQCFKYLNFRAKNQILKLQFRKIGDCLEMTKNHLKLKIQMRQFWWFSYTVSHKIGNWKFYSQNRRKSKNLLFFQFSYFQCHIHTINWKWQFFFGEKKSIVHALMMIKVINQT